MTDARNGGRPSAAASVESLPARLEERAPGRWELYAKAAESWERVTTIESSRTAWRREEGWAARVWEDDGLRFAAGASPGELLEGLSDASGFASESEPAPAWPSRVVAAGPASPSQKPPDLFEVLARRLSEITSGACSLARLSLRQGTISETIRNGGGLDVAQARSELDGVATAIARRGDRASEVRIPFRGPQAPDPEALARRLGDAATLPLAEPASPPSRGEWLLDPAVGAALIAGLAPLFTSERPPRWIARGALASPEVGIADDASSDSPFDGEGVATRRVLLVEAGQRVGSLLDLRTARRRGGTSTGHGVRPSFRTPPSAGARRIFFETKSPRPAADLLAAVRRGVYASAVLAPPRIDLVADRFEIAFTGVAVLAGRAKGPIPAARASGRLSDLLRRIQALSADVQFFPLPFAAGAPTMLIEPASFD